MFVVDVICCAQRTSAMSARVPAALFPGTDRDSSSAGLPCALRLPRVACIVETCSKGLTDLDMV